MLNLQNGGFVSEDGTFILCLIFSINIDHIWWVICDLNSSTKDDVAMVWMAVLSLKINIVSVVVVVQYDGH